MWAPDSKSTGEPIYGVAIRLTDLPGTTYSGSFGDHEGELQRSLHINENKSNLANYREELITLYHEWDFPEKAHFAGVNNSCAKTKTEGNIEERGKNKMEEAVMIRK